MRTRGLGAAFLAPALVATTLGACTSLEPRAPIKEGAEVQVASGRAASGQSTRIDVLGRDGEMIERIEVMLDDR